MHTKNNHTEFKSKEDYLKFDGIISLATSIFVISENNLFAFDSFSAATKTIAVTIMQDFLVETNLELYLDQFLQE
jgi:hypothetical protein